MSVLGRRLRWIADARTTSAAVANTLVSRFAILGLNFCTGVLVARLLGPVGRGEYAAMTLWPIVVCGLMMFGIPQALRYEIRRRSHDRDELFSTAVVIAMVLATVAFCVGLFLIPILLSHYPADVIRFSQWLMLFAPVITFQLVSQAYLEARGEFTRSNRLLYVPPLITLPVLGVLVALHQLQPKSVALAYFVPSGLVYLALACRLRRSIRVPREIRRTGKPLIHYGVRAYGLDVLGLLYTQVDQTLIVHFMSAASFGLYGVALTIARTLGIFAVSLNTVLFPKASGLELRDAIALVGRSARLTLATTALAGVLSCLIFPILIPLVYGKAYEPVILLATILTVDVVIGATTNVLSQAFMATGRPGIVTTLQAGALATAIPLMLVLIPRIGLPGAAVALLTTTVLRLVSVLACYPTLLRHRVPRLYLNARDVQELRANLRTVH